MTLSLQTAIVCAVVYYVMTGLDTLMSWQTITRPIVLAPVVGLFLGDLHTGIVMGAQLEALFMGISAIGGAIASDPTTGSIISVAYVISVSASGGDVEAAIATGMALAMPIGTVMNSINGLFSPISAAMAGYWEKLAGEANPKKFLLLNFAVFLVLKLPQTITLGIAVALGTAGLDAFIASVPAFVLTGFSAAGAMMTSVGFGILLSMIWDPQICAFYFVGFVCAKSLGLSSLGIAIIGTTIAVTIFFIEKAIVDAKNSAGPATAAASSEEDFF